MNRKILQAGPATLAISLPMSWVKKLNLKKGQELGVEEKGNALKINTRHSIEEESAIVDVSSLHPISTKIIGMLYKMGYKKIKALYTPNKSVIRRGKEVKELDMIKNTFDQLTGMQLWEIGKQDDKHYALSVESAKVNPGEFSNVLNKLCLHLIHQAEQVYETLSENRDSFDEAYLTERLITQTTDFCTRILASFSFESDKKTLVYYDLLLKLESLGDKFFEISLHFNKTKEKVDKNTLEILEKSVSLIKEIVSIYGKFNIAKLTNLTNELNNLMRNYEEKIKNHEVKGIISYNAYSILIELNELIETLYFFNYDYFKEN